MGILAYPAQEIGTSRHRYQARQQNVIQQLFREQFEYFETVYEQRHADTCGRYRLPVIQRAANAFKLCGIQSLLRSYVMTVKRIQ